GPWSSSADKTIHLPEDDPTVFTHYIQLLYISTASIKQPETADPSLDQENLDLARLYVLAHKLQDTHSQNLIVSTMLLKSRALTPSLTSGPPGQPTIFLPNVQAINTIHGGTGGACGARRLLADLH
ncbi:hypothetical protein K458DRAFT_248338, partial [Lentithecium fluviatile CBS 122367]